MTAREAGEAGYAMVTAVVAMALLALFSLALIDSARGVAAGAAAGIERARLDAAADAGLAYAVANLSASRGERWGLDGRPHGLDFAGARLTIVVEDERGKVPINQITEEQTRTMFEALGSSGPELDIQVESFLDWLDDDDEARPSGAEAAYYAPHGIRPRNGALRSIDELMHIRGMTRALLARLRPAVSVATASRDGFDDRYAQPFAMMVMSGNTIEGPAELARARELAGDRVAIELDDNADLVGRPLLVRVAAIRPGGARLQRSAVIELTGQRAPAFIVRRFD